MNLKKLGMRIKYQREKKKLRQIDIAHALQISPQAVSKWERGENAPDISLLVTLSKMLNISIEWLLADDLGTGTFEAAVFCTSLNGFAEKSKSMPPQELAIWTNSLFSSLTEIVLKYNGVPVKYVGDGFLAFFTGEKAQKKAVEAATTAKKLISNEQLVIAIHYGSVFLGTIGHPDYSSRDILGAPVNTCFLIMPWVAQNCVTGIGVTKEVAMCHDDFECKGKIVMNDDSSIQIFEQASDKKHRNKK